MYKISGTLRMNLSLSECVVLNFPFTTLYKELKPVGLEFVKKGVNETGNNLLKQACRFHSDQSCLCYCSLHTEFLASIEQIRNVLNN